MPGLVWCTVHPGVAFMNTFFIDLHEFHQIFVYD